MWKPGHAKARMAPEIYIAGSIYHARAAVNLFQHFRNEYSYNMFAITLPYYSNRHYLEEKLMIFGICSVPGVLIQ